MADFTQAMNNNKPTLVLDTDANKVLNNIYSFLNRQQATNSQFSRAQQDTTDAINELIDQQHQQNSREVVQSMAAARRDRAVNSALFGNINRTTKAIDGLKDSIASAFKELIDIVGNMAKESLKAYDDTARSLRKQFLSTDQIKADLIKSNKSKATLEDAGMTVTSSETKAIIAQLREQGADTSRLTNEQVGAITVMNKVLGTDIKTAMATIKTSTDPMKLAELLASRGSDTTGKATLANLMNKSSEPWFQQFASTVGGTNKAIEKLLEQSQSLDATLGDYNLNNEVQSSIIETFAKGSAKLFNNIDDNQLKNILGFTKGEFTPENFISGIKDFIANNNKSYDQKRAELALLQGAGVDESLVASLLQAVAAKENGIYTEKSIRSAEEGLRAFNENIQGGKIGGIIDGLITGIDNSTGGALSGISAELNRWFGDNLGMETVVTNGFKTVVMLLGAIAAKQFGGSLLNLGKGLLGKFKGLGKFGKSATSKLDDIGKGVATSAKEVSKSTGKLDKLGKLAKGSKFIKGMGALAAIGGAVEIASIATSNYTNIGDKLEIPADSVKKVFENRKVEDKMADLGKTVITTATAFGAGTLGMKIGAGIGTVFGPGVGTAIGGAIGAAVGAGISSLIDDYTAASSLEDALKAREDTENHIKRLENTISELSKAGLDTSRQKADLEKNKQNLILQEKDIKDKRLNDARYDSDSRELMRYLSERSGVLSSLQADIEKANKQYQKAVISGTVSAGTLENLQSYIDSAKLEYMKESNFYSRLLAQAANTNMLSDDFDKTREKVFERSSKEDIIAEFNRTSKKLNRALEDPVDEFKILAENVKEMGGSINLINTSIVHSKPFAKGGIVSGPTSALIGEDGKEAVLPLTKPGELSKVLASLSPVEKRNILQTITRNKINTKEGLIAAVEDIISNRFVGPTMFDPSVITSGVASGKYKDEIDGIINSKYLRGIPWPLKASYAEALKKNIKVREKAYADSINNAGKRSSGDNLISGTPAARMLDWGLTKLGTPYILNSLGGIGYVCNEFVNAALANSGFDRKGFRIWGVGRTFSNINSGGKYTKDYPGFRLHTGLRPEEATPGMIFFSTRNNRDIPGHTGLVYYGNQIMHASGSSKSYTREGFLNGFSTNSRGVSITPFSDSSKYAFLEFPDMYNADGYNSTLSTNLASTLNPDNGVASKLEAGVSDISSESTLSEQQSLAKEAIDSVVEQTSGGARQAAVQYAKQAYTLLNNGNTDEIVSSLGSIIKYLRDIASSPANRRSMAPVARPGNLSF